MSDQPVTAATPVPAEPVLPTVTDGNRPYWEGGLVGELRLQRCAACGHLRYPISADLPDAACPPTRPGSRSPAAATS